MSVLPLLAARGSLDLTPVVEGLSIDRDRAAQDRRIGRVVAHRAEVWREAEAHRVQAQAVRRKIEADPQAPRLIQTVTGVGYRFGGQPDA